jgi:hypothetical protein
MNVLHVRTGGVGGAAEADNLGEALTAITAFYTALKNTYAYGTRITIGEGMVKDPLGSPEYVDDDARILTADGVAGSAPVLLALVASWRTTSATRSGHGRTFLGPLAPDFLQTDGTPNNNFVNTFRNAANNLVADSQSANGWAFGVLSTKQGIFRDVTGVTIRDRFSYLSSRRD